MSVTSVTRLTHADSLIAQKPRSPEVWRTYREISSEAGTSSIGPVMANCKFNGTVTIGMVAPSRNNRELADCHERNGSPINTSSTPRYSPIDKRYSMRSNFDTKHSKKKKKQPRKSLIHSHPNTTYSISALLNIKSEFNSRYRDP